MKKLIKGNKTAELVQDGVLTHRFDLTDEDTALMIAELEQQVDEVQVVNSDVTQHPEQPEIDYSKSILE